MKITKKTDHLKTQNYFKSKPFKENCCKHQPSDPSHHQPSDPSHQVVFHKAGIFMVDEDKVKILKVDSMDEVCSKAVGKGRIAAIDFDDYGDNKSVVAVTHKADVISLKMVGRELRDWKTEKIEGINDTRDVNMVCIQAIGKHVFVLGNRNGVSLIFHLDDMNKQAKLELPPNHLMKAVVKHTTVPGVVFAVANEAVMVCMAENATISLLHKFVINDGLVNGVLPLEIASNANRLVALAFGKKLNDGGIARLTCTL